MRRGISQRGRIREETWGESGSLTSCCDWGELGFQREEGNQSFGDDQSRSNLREAGGGGGIAGKT